MRAGQAPVASAEAGVGAPVGQAVANPEVIDGQQRAAGDVEVRELAHVVVVLRRRTREVLLLLPHALVSLSGSTRKMDSSNDSLKRNKRV